MAENFEISGQCPYVREEMCNKPVFSTSGCVASWQVKGYKPLDAVFAESAS
jgi:hypothetical protein